MDATRISIARVLDLDVPMSWREVTAVLCEAVSIARQAGGSSSERPPLQSWVVTRGGAVVLEPDAAQSRPEVLVTFARDLIKACRAPDVLGEAMQSGRVLAFVDEFKERTSPAKRRVDIASLALRALAAEADVASSLADFISADEADRPAEPTAPRLWSRQPAPEVPLGVVDDFVFRDARPLPTPAAVERRTGARLGTVTLLVLATAGGIVAWQWWPTSAPPSPPDTAAPRAILAAPPTADSAPPVPDDVDVRSVPELEQPPIAEGPPIDAIPAPIPPETAPVLTEAPPAADPAPVPYVPVAPLARSPDGTIDDPIVPWQSAGLEPPTLLSRVRPGTDVLAQNLPASGLTIEVLVDRAGRVEDVRILSGSSGLSRDRQRAVLAAARRWQFTPARLNGQLVRSTARVTVPP